MKTVLEIINKSKEFLKGKGVKNSRREAVDLISGCLGMGPLDLYMQHDRPLTEGELDVCRAALMRRGKGEPIQYIRGEVEFFGCTISVNQNVLIPRQETELLVDLIAKDLATQDLRGKSLWDVCCGSGCIGVALKKAFPTLEVFLSDLSEPALDVARFNAKLNEVSVSVLQGDFLLPFGERQANFIVCNPPYISEEEFSHLEVEVRGFEPRLALVGGRSGLSFYEQLAGSLCAILLPGGKLWLEIGHQQGAAVVQIFESIAARRKQLMQDLSGADRFFFLEMENCTHVANSS